MASILLILAVLLAFVGVLITGDFSQYAYKPTHQQIYFVLKNRLYLISGSILFWLMGLIWHQAYAPTVPWFLILSGILATLFITVGFFMPGYILFPGLKQPKWISAADADAHLSPDEPIIGVEINNDARAYPLDAVLRPHLVTDTIGGEAVTMSYCMLCNSAMAFKPEVAQQRLDLMVPLQWENNLMLYDASTQNLIQQITGEIVQGPDSGQTLPTYPTRIMPWAAWQQLHPDTKVMHHPPQNWFDNLVRTMLRTQIFEPNLRQEKPFFPTISDIDSRLPNKAEVLGVCVQDACKAYPFTVLEQQHIINDDLHNTPLLIAYDPKQDAADVFFRQTLTFHHEMSADGSYLLIDEQTNSKWNLTGQAITGPLAGTQLKPYPHFSRVFWFSWINFYPQTELA
jgi:hypothetical protein